MKKGRPGYLDSQKKKEILKNSDDVWSGHRDHGDGLSDDTYEEKSIDCRCSLRMSSGRKISCRRDHEVAVPFDRTERSRRDRTGSRNLPVVYDLVVTSYEKIMPIDCMTVSDHVMIGYTRSKKTDPAYAQKHITQILSQNAIRK